MTTADTLTTTTTTADVTTATDAAPTLDERLFRDTIGALELFGVYLGRRLGLYRAVHEAGAVTVAELAAAAGIAERYAREWLEQQAVAGVLAVDDAAAPAERRRFSVPADHVGVLVAPDDPTHVSPLADMVVGVAQALGDVAEAYRSGGGVPYVRYGEDFRYGQGGVNRPAFTHDLCEAWIPAVPALHERLASAPSRIADVGCGHGWSAQALARAYPQAAVVGLDGDEPSVAEARRHAAEAGSAATFEVADAAAIDRHGPFDLVVVLEALHDMARPAEALASARKALAPGGTLLVADEKVADAFVAPGDEMERFMYGWSISHCLPASMAEAPSAALGTVLRRSTVEDLARQAGFASCEVVDVDAGFFNLYRLQG